MTSTPSRLRRRGTFRPPSLVHTRVTARFSCRPGRTPLASALLWYVGIMKLRSLFLGSVLPLALGLSVLPREAKACGGCFIPPGIPTVVTGHRMAMTVSPTQSVLWDQIQYSGEPEDFAWVLPVKKGARIEAANVAFFEVLEGVTATRIQQPPVNCGGGGSGCGGDFASAESLDSGGDGGDYYGGEPVEVVHHGTVGPYETVTLSTDTPGALNTWLTDNGYNVDASSQPIVDQYIAEGFDFIALRLQPGKGVSQMTPVRVVSSGSNVTLPLRMVAIGTGAETPIVLYVIGEGRYGARDFEDVSVDTGLLSWDFRTQESNYPRLRLKALEANGGKSFLTSYANAGVLTGAAGDATTGPLLFPERYGLQAYQNGEAAFLCKPSIDSFETRVVRNPCPDGEPWHSPACGAVDASEVDGRTFGCPGVDDVAVALEGLHPSNTWVTRLEANLPQSALVTDLTLEATPGQASELGILQAEIPVNFDYACGSATAVLGPIDPTKQIPVGTVFGVALGALGLALVKRRTVARA